MLVWWAGASPALAVDPAANHPVARSTAFGREPVAGWAVFELRGGLASSAAGARTMLCAEASPHRLLALEACGSGSGFLYAAAPGAVDIVHFRAEASIPILTEGRTDLVLQAGAGFTEVQRGQDAPGFAFGPARSPDQVEGAGPSGSVALKARGWVRPGAYVSAEVDGGAAWIPAAPTVLGTAGPLRPFVTVSVGAGF